MERSFEGQLFMDPCESLEPGCVTDQICCNYIFTFAVGISPQRGSCVRFSPHILRSIFTNCAFEPNQPRYPRVSPGVLSQREAFVVPGSRRPLVHHASTIFHDDDVQLRSGRRFVHMSQNSNSSTHFPRAPNSTPDF